MKKLIIGGVVSLFLLIVLGNIVGLTRIDAANEGIEVKLTGSDKDRGVNDVTLVSGWNLYNKLSTAIYETPLTERQVNYPAYTVTTKDNSVFTIDPTMSYNVIKGNSPAIFKRYRKPLEQLEPTIMFQIIKDATRDVANSMTSDSLMSNRTIFENAVQSKVAESYTKTGFNLVNFTSGVTPPQSLTDAINLKNVAIQNAIKYQNEAKAETEKAKIIVAKSKGEAEAEVAAAKGRFEAAVYDAKAQKEKAAVLTPLLVRMKELEKWNGSYIRNDFGKATPLITQ